MHWRIGVILLLTLSFALFSPLTVMAANVTAIGGGPEPDTRLSKDQLKYKGGPKAATTSQRRQPDTPKEEPKASPPAKRDAPSTP